MRRAKLANAKGAEPDGPNCNGCGSVFGMFNWKHHCRRCGKAFCDNCSKDRAVLSAPEFGKEPQRVCHPCKVAERRFRLEGQGKRGNRRESDDAKSGPVVDLGLGADPLSGQELGQPMTAADLEDPLVSEMLADLGFDGAKQTAGSANKPVGKAGAPAVWAKGKAATTPPPSPGIASEAAVNDAVAAEKKRAVALRKAGKGDEALQVLRHAHALEAQAGADGAKAKGPGVSTKGGKGKSMFDISDADMVDPVLLAELQELGWSEEPAAKPKRKPVAAPVTAGGGDNATAGGSTAVTAGGNTTVTPPKSAKTTAGDSPDKRAVLAERATAGGNATVTNGSSPDKRAALEAEVTARKRAALQLRKSGQLEQWHAEMGALRELQAQLDQQDEAPPAAGPQVPASDTATGGGSVVALRRRPQNEASSGASRQDNTQEASFAEQRTDRTGGTADGPASKEALERAIVSRKRAALACKKAGDLEGAKAAMKEARLLENQLASASHVADVKPPAVGVSGQDGARSSPTKPLNHEAEHHDPDVTSDDEADPEIAAALREMGWQDGNDGRTETAALRRQLSDRKAGEGLDALVGAVEGVAAQKAAMAADAAARKRAALAKKRAGDIEGAKEELRQAKMIEARLEEAEAAEAAGLEPLDGLLQAGGRGAKPAARGARGAAAAAPLATIVADAMRPDVGEMAAPDVDSDDETDPEILAALREMGWQDEKPGRASSVPQRGAVRQQTAGARQPSRTVGQQRKMGGAATQFDDGGEDDVAVTSDDEQDPEIAAALREMGWQEERPGPAPASAPSAPPRPAARPRGREELLAQAGALKRQALGLRKQAKMDEWRATLMEAQELEREAEQAGTARPTAAAAALSRPSVTAGDGADEHVEVTEDDETDPAMQAALRALGWQEDDPPPRAVPVIPPRRAPTGSSSVGQERVPVQNSEKYRVAPVDSNFGYRVTSGNSNVGHQSTPVDSTGGYRVSSVDSIPGHSISPGDSTGGYRVTPVSAGPLPADLFSTAVEAPRPTGSNAQVDGRFDDWTGVGRSAGRESGGANSVGDRVVGGYPVAGGTGLRVQDAQPASRVSGDGALPDSQAVPGGRSLTNSAERPERRGSQETGGRPLRTSEDRRSSQSAGQSEASKTASGPPLHWPESSPKKDREPVSTPGRRYSPSSAGALGTGFVSGGKSSPGEPPGRRESSSTAGTSSVPPPFQPETSPGDERRRVSTYGRQDSALPAAPPVGASATDLEERVRTGKQNAVRLKREGRLQEARAALMQAREWERQLAVQQATSDGAKDAPEEMDGEDASVEDAFDPAMVAALKGLGWTDEQIRGGMGGGGGGKPAAKAAARPAAAAAAGGGERIALEDRIRSEKLRALGLKRAGMQQEALAVLRSVKQLEKQLG